MRPTFSIILFTVLSGAGYGLLFLLGLRLAFGAPLDTGVISVPASSTLVMDPRLALGVALATGFVLTTIGLLASVAHLGKPLRAWRAFSQWRSSWLSREGIAALLTCVPVLAIAVILLAQPDAITVIQLLGFLLATCCTVTVYCTARIYGCLLPVRAWNNAYTTPGYLLLGLYGGALWFAGIHWTTSDRGAMGFYAALFVIGLASALLKRHYWIHLDSLSAVSPGTATGLDRLGRVQRFEQPHTEENYLTHEMGFVLARKHSRRLRAITFWSILLAPLVTFLPGLLIGWPAAWLGLLVGMTGILVERWLFFAEARHAVMAYYGR